MLVTNEIYPKRQTPLSLVALLIGLCYTLIFQTTHMNNELFVCIKKIHLDFLSQREISICRFKEHLCGFKYFSFSVSDVCFCEPFLPASFTKPSEVRHR